MSKSDDRTELERRIIAAFESGEALGAPAVHVGTALSDVFLAGDRAVKLSRNVKLPYADLSTVERRARNCAAAIEVNRRFAPSLYLGTEWVVEREDGRIAVGGAGRRLEPAVLMRRFDGERQFDRLAARGALTVRLVEETAEAVANAHARAPAERAAERSTDYAQAIDDLEEAERRAAARLGLSYEGAPLYAAARRSFADAEPLIVRRRESGRTRRVHGDLHLRNICLLDGRPTPFDAMEFDERLATVDVVYDLAFLLMDLVRVGLKPHANAAMNRYWDVAGEAEEALSLLPFFTGLRATVRSAVALAGDDATEAEAYRELGLRLMERARPRLVAVGGLSGTGKSTVAKALAPHLPGTAGARLLRTDVVRKQALGVAEGKAASAAAYTDAARADVYRMLAERSGAALEAGASVLVDGTFTTSDACAAIEALGAGGGFAGLWLTAPLATRLARVSGRSGDASDADAGVAAAQKELDDLGPFWRRVDASGTPDEATRNAADALGL